MTDTSPTNRLLPSYGRRRGRKLKASKEALIENLLPKIMVQVPEDGSRLDVSALFTKPNPLWLEIGFGGGEHLAALAEAKPDINFIGCEPYINGAAHLLKAIDDKHLANIRLLQSDARPLLDALTDASVERMYVMFPDPWPKTRHNKRRLVAEPFLKQAARVLKPGFILRIATDHEDYAAWILEHLLACPDFRWTAQAASDWHRQFDGSVQTRYQAKALREGRNPAFFEFVRV